MNNFIDQLLTYIWDSPDLTANVIETVGTILILWLIRFIVLRVIRRASENQKTQYKWRKNVSYITSFIGLLVIGQIWFSGIESLATFLGLVSAGLAIALKDPVTDLAAWMFVIWRKPFDVGDRIEKILLCSKYMCVYSLQCKKMFWLITCTVEPPLIFLTELWTSSTNAKCESPSGVELIPVSVMVCHADSCDPFKSTSE